MKTKIEDLHKIYSNGRSGPVEALRGVNLEIGSSEFVSIVGPSGCGKSTLLMIVAGLVEATSGRVIFLNERQERRPSAGIVFQELALFPWRTVAGNVSYGLEELGLPKKERKERIRKLLQMTGLEGFEDSYPHQLSGGMKQRVAIARAMATEPRLLLMDEPLSSLDAITRQQMQMELSRIYESGSMSFLYVTHDISEAIFLADKLVVMSKRPGRVLGTFSVELPRPRTQEVRKLKSFLELVAGVTDLLEKEWEPPPLESP
jgi:NitT/TauT family transport system ATP-binding protein